MPIAKQKLCSQPAQFSGKLSKKNNNKAIDQSGQLVTSLIAKYR